MAEDRQRELQQAVAERLRAERGLAAGRMATLRLAGVGFFAGLTLVLGQVLELKGWTDDPIALWMGYLALAVVIWGASRLVEKPAWAAWDIPLIDAPMIYLLIRESAGGGSVSGVGSFAVGPLSFMVVLAALTFDRRVMATAAVVAAGLSSHLMLDLAESPGGAVSAAAVVLLVAAAAHYLVGRVRHLVESVASEQVRRERLGRYFSPAVAEAVAGQGLLETGGSQREVTVLFSDIRGFTSMSEAMPPGDVVQFLNDYLAAMVDLIFEHGGTLDKVLGDGILAYFGAPVAHEDHARRALSCALKMQDEVERISRERTAAGLPAVRIGIGLHTGPAIVGAIGSPRRKEFTVIGDTVNLASRIEGLTKPLQRSVLLSEQTHSEVSEYFATSPLPPTEVKGKAKPVRTWSPDSEPS